MTTVAAPHRPGRHAFQLRPIACGVMLACCELALSNPTGPQVMQGNVQLQGLGTSSLKVTNSPGSIIHWQGFSIGAGQATQFIQQSATSAVLNRVVGADISRIQGSLTSNGRVFLINPAGILIGAGALIDTAGFVGSSLNMQDADFLAGKLRFQGPANAGAVVNQGWIKAGRGGNVVLVAPNVENGGVIQAEGGQIVLAAGQKMTIGSLELEGVQFEIQAPKDTALNLGKLLADGGAVGVFAGTLRHSGDIRANALTRDETGRVVLKAQGLLEVAGAVSTKSDSGPGGRIAMSGDVLVQTGAVSANGLSGGQVAMNARNLLSAGPLSADGAQGAGGAVDVHASSQLVQTASARISASGSGGDGGRITVQGDSRIFTSADLAATGSGDAAKGGTVNVLGDDVVVRGARVDASGDARGGTVLVGGDWQGRNPAVPNAQRTEVNFSTAINADARQAGDGGKVVVWSDKVTKFFGQVFARGGAQSGDGGRVEVSGKDNLTFGGFVNASASNGTPGTLLLDPKNIVIDAPAGATVIDLVDPDPSAGENFGAFGRVTVLPNGNVAVMSPLDDFGATDAGAAYLFSGTTGALLTKLTGSNANDQVGGNGINVLPNGSYLVMSNDWNGGAGAVTPAAATGVNGVVGPGNSLVGSNPGDAVGSGGITQLLNGTSNYVVKSPNWNGNAGAATFSAAGAPTLGAVGAGNSLIGAAGNRVGSDVRALENGNYVVATPDWDNNGAIAQAGAVTWGNGTTGTVGQVDATNSLVGSSANDHIGDIRFGGSITLLPGAASNYVVASPVWDRTGAGAAVDAGAVTWRSGSGSPAGAITALNSLIGASANDKVGSAIFVLPGNGNYVVASPDWTNTAPAAAQAGAVTWGSNAAGVAGEVSAANSLVGTSANDRVGLGDPFPVGGTPAVPGVTPLDNGNYVVNSPQWSDPITPAANVGAVTWANGTTGRFGALDDTNSLIGSTASDQIGLGGITVLPVNSNYVVRSFHWANNTGAVTWGSGTAGVAGLVSATNSLVGAAMNDLVGDGGVFALNNGNYVVASPNWANGAQGSAGAATWGSGIAGVIGTVTVGNSLVGTTAGDQVAGTATNDSIFPLNNGNYLVRSPFWNNQAGAVTWRPGTSVGVVGAVAAGNSLIGGAAGHQVGSGGIFQLSNGNYLVLSPEWSGTLGAVTFGSGTAGVSGLVTSTNSLVGASAGDRIGDRIFGRDPIVELTGNTNFVVLSPTWDRDISTADAGAFTWGSGTTGVSGVVSAANSMVGGNANDAVGNGFVYALPNGNYAVQSVNWNGNTGAVTFGTGTAPTIGTVGAANSLVGSAANDQVGAFGVTVLNNGNYLVNSPFWNNNAGAVSFGTAAGGVAGAVSATNSLIGSAANDQVGGGGFGIVTLPNGNYVVHSPNWNGNMGAVTFGNAGTGVFGAVSAANSLVGATANDNLGNAAVTPIGGANRVFVASPDYDNPAALVDSGRLQIYDGSTGGGGFTNPLTFATTPAGNATFTPAALTSITNAGTAVTLQANNDITLAAGSDIVTTGAGTGGAITMQAGRSIILNSNITTNNGTLTLVANETVANGVDAANRDAGAAVITMAPGTTLNTGTGNLFLTLGTGAGHAGTSGDITVGNLLAGNVSLVHRGPTAGNSIVRNDANALLAAGTSIFMELASTGGIGAAGAPLNVATPAIEAHTTSAGSGIYIASPHPRDLQIGGVPAAIFNGATRGIQTVGGAPIEIAVNGNLTRLNGGTGGPIVSNGGNVTLRASTLGSTGANGRIQVSPGTGLVDARTTVGGLFLEHTAGNVDNNQYTMFVPVGGQPVELATTNGTITFPNTTFTGDARLTFITGGAGNNIAFTGTGTMDALSLDLRPAGATVFNVGTYNVNTPVTSSGIVTLAGGTTNFNGVTTLAAPMNVTGGTLGGTGAVSATDLAFTNGTIANTGGVTVTGSISVNGNVAHTLSGTLTGGALHMTQGSLDITNTGALNLTNAGAKTISGAGTAVNNAGLFRIAGNDLALESGAAFNNTGTFDFAGDVGIASTTGALPTFTSSGVVSKSAGGSTSTIGITRAFDFSNTGTLHTQTGTLALAANNTFGNGTQFTGAGMNVVAGNTTFNGTIDSTNLTLQSGNFGGNATLGGTTAWTGGAMTGSFTVPNGATLSFTGATPKNITGAGALLVNNGTLALSGSGGIAGTGSLQNAGTINANDGGALMPIAVALTSTGTIDVQAGTLRASSFPTNAGTLSIGQGAVFSTNGAPLVSSGTIGGRGTLDLGGATLTSSGTLAPGASPGTLVINGDYTQTSLGTLAIELGGTSQGNTYDLLQVNGTANLAGTLSGTLVNGYAPSGRQSFDFMTYNARTGDFTQFALPASFQSLAKPAAYEMTFVGQSLGRPGIADNETRRTNDTLLGTLTSLVITPDPRKAAAHNVCN